jgi:hypothetical protein
MNFEKEINECFSKIKMNKNEYSKYIDETIKQIKKKIVKEVKNNILKNYDDINLYCINNIEITNDLNDKVKLKDLYFFFNNRKFTYTEFSNYIKNSSIVSNNFKKENKEYILEGIKMINQN